MNATGAIHRAPNKVRFGVDLLLGRIQTSTNWRANRECSQFVRRLGFALLLLLGLPASSIAESRVVSWGYYWRTVGPPFFPANSPPANLTDVVAVAGGAGHSVALMADGRVRPWGDNSLGQTLTPAGLSNVIMVACGTFHSLALRSDGSVVGWGAGRVYAPQEDSGLHYGQSRVPVDLTNAVAVAAGYLHSMALRADGTLVVWGSNSSGQTNVPGGLDNVVAIASGQNFCLALRADGTVVSWGNQLAATVPPSATSIVAIAAGNSHHALALRADGAVLSWGGENSAGERTVPVGLSNVVALATGGAHSLALDAEGKVTAWGAGMVVDIPNGEFGQSMVPANLGSTAGIGAGDLHSLALLREGPPVLFLPAVNRTLVYGSTAWLSVPGIAVPSLHYQWRFNGTNLPAGTNALLTLEHVTFADQGVYSLLVSNQFGTATSSNLAVIVVPLMITNQPQSQAALIGSTVILTVGAKGRGPFSYQWQFNGTDMLGETNRTLVLAHARSSDSGDYAVLVGNLAGAVRSKEATVSVSDRAVVYWGSNLAGLTNGTLGLTNVVAVAAGRSHALALQADGKVLAWGANAFQTNVPSDLSNVVAISAGGFHSLALKADGKVVAWGYIDSPPANLDQVVAIAAGSFHNVALKSDGTVAVWGQTNAPVGLSNVVAVAAGQSYSMALKADGTVFSWGTGPSVPANLTNVVAIAGGASHGLALRANGTIAAWGQNSYGQANVPDGLTNVVAISAGENHSLALKANGTVVAWGDGGTNVIGFPRPPFPGRPNHGQSIVPAGLTNVTAIAAGYNQSLAVVGGGQPFLTGPLVSRVATYGQTLSLRIPAQGAGPMCFQWMFNGTNLPGATNTTLTLNNVRFDQAGNYSVRVSNAFGEVVSSDMMLSVAPLMITVQPKSQSTHQGATVRFSVTANGQGPFTYQWRFNGVDLPAATNSALVLHNVRIEHSGLYSVVVGNAVGSVASENAALSVGQVITWGNNDFGQTNLPTGLTNVISIAAGSYHSLALRADGTVVAWGANSGTVAAGQTNVPAGLSNVVAIAAGGHSLALKADGTVAGWGNNTEGQISIPTGLKDVTAIAAGSAHSLALKRDGTVVGWGNNYYGQAQAPSALRNVVAIAAGIPQSMALKTDGTVSVWGDDGWGESRIPSGLSNVVAIAAGWQHCVALKSDGTVSLWGAGYAGQTNVPSGLTNVVAISAGGHHTLLRTADGRLVRWGDIPYVIPSVLSNLIAFSAGGAHDLALVGAVPAITLQPVSQKATVGLDASFAVTATGTEPLSYQWRRDGMDVPGATNSVLVLTNIQSSSGGAYSVRITNAFGPVTSSNAFLAVNHPPVADATATKAGVISCNHSNATIVLDASRSYDPDGDPLQYSWFQDGALDALATEIVAPMVLPVGSHAIRLVVNDGLASREQTINLDLITINQALVRLSALVRVNVPRSQPLMATLSATLAAVSRGNSTAAINQLQAFQHQLRAQVTRLDLPLAQSLHQKAQDIVDTLKSDCGSGTPPGKLAMITHRRDGKVRMQFSALPTAIYVVEASTNLMHWNKIGVAAEHTPGHFEFEDLNCIGLPSRFYRLVQP